MDSIVPDAEILREKYSDNISRRVFRISVIRCKSLRRQVGVERKGTYLYDLGFSELPRWDFLRLDSYLDQLFQWWRRLEFNFGYIAELSQTELIEELLTVKLMNNRLMDRPNRHSRKCCVIDEIQFC